MPFIGERNVVPDASSHLFAELITTTLYTYPTTGADVHANSHPIPIAAIAGGVAGGALLAVAIVVGWVCWGKAIKRSHAKQVKEAEALRKTRTNTVHNAVSSRPRMDIYRPLYAPPMDKKIRFVGHNKQISQYWGSSTPKSILSGSHFTTQPPPPAPAEKPPRPPRLRPKPLRTVRGSTHLAALAAEQNKGSSIPPGDPESRNPQRISHKPSNASSISAYSTASGEEHQLRAPSNLILAALGFGGAYGGGDRNSGVSSRWSLISRFTEGVQGGNLSNRPSQASMNSDYPASVDSSGLPIGVAL